MTVGNIPSETNPDGPCPFYVRLQNLPFGTCQKQVSDFFGNLHVPLGGVSIHRSCAFVAFDSEVNVQLAVAMDQQIFGGNVVRVSNAVRRDVLKTQVYEVRRRLSVSMATNRQKRIRPTLLKEGVDEGIGSKKFCPEEVDFPADSEGTLLQDETETKLCCLDEKVPEMKNQPCLMDGSVAQRRSESYLKNAGKIHVSSGVASDSLFKDGMESKAMRRVPLRKTIKPTPVYTLSQFNLVY